jgi:hypothetical protein
MKESWLAEGCPELKDVTFNSVGITDLAILNLLRHCLILRRLYIAYCHAVTRDGLSRHSIGEGGSLMKTLKLVGMRVLPIPGWAT